MTDSIAEAPVNTGQSPENNQRAPLRIYKGKEATNVLNNGENGQDVAVSFKLRTGKQAERNGNSAIGRLALQADPLDADRVIQPPDVRRVNLSDAVILEQRSDGGLYVQTMDEDNNPLIARVNATDLENNNYLIPLNDQVAVEIVKFDPDQREVALHKVKIPGNRQLVPSPGRAVVPYNQPGALVPREVALVPYDDNRKVATRDEPGTLEPYTPPGELGPYTPPGEVGPYNPPGEVGPHTPPVEPEEPNVREAVIGSRDIDPWKKARELAGNLIDKEMRRGSILDIRNWGRKIGLGQAKEYWRQRLTHEIHDAMIAQNNSLLELDMTRSTLTTGDFFRGQGGSRNLTFTNANQTQEQAESQAAVVDIKLRQTEGLAENLQDVGANRTDIVEAQGQLKQAIIRDIIRPIAEGRDSALTNGRITNQADIQNALRRFVEANQNDPQVIALFGRDTTQFGRLAEYFATDLLEMSNLVKEDISAHKYALDQIDAHTKILLSNPSWYAETQGQFDEGRISADKFVRWIEKHRVSGALVNPATVGLAFSLGIYGASRLLSSGARVGGAALAPFTAGSSLFAGALAGGGLAAARRNYELKNDLARHQVGRFAGGEIDQNPNKPDRRREDMERFRYATASATELSDRLRQTLSQDLSPTSTTNREAVLREIADITTRTDFGRRQKIDLITFGSRNTVRQERTQLTVDLVNARRALRAAGMSDTEIQNGETRFRAEREQFYTTNKEQQDREFAHYRLGKAMMAGGLGAAAGIAGGLLGQQALAGIERGFLHMEVGKTVLESGKEAIGHVAQNLTDGRPLGEGIFGAAGSLAKDKVQDLFNNPGNLELDNGVSIHADPYTLAEHEMQNGSPGGYEHARAISFWKDGHQINTSPLFATDDGKVIAYGTEGKLDQTVRDILGQAKDLPKTADKSDQWFNIRDDIKDMLQSGRNDAFIQWHHMMVDVTKPMDTLPDGSRVIHMVYGPEGGGANWGFDLTGKVGPDGQPLLNLDTTGLPQEQIETLKSELKLDGWDMNSTTSPESTISETRNVFGPDGEWTKHTTQINRTEWYAYNTSQSDHNELLEKTYKEGSKLILGANQMGVSSERGLVPPSLDVQEAIRNHQVAWRFDIPGHGSIVVPDGVDGNFDGRLTLDPNADPSITFNTPEGPMKLRDFSQLVLNQDAYKNMADGDIATELNKHYDVWRIGNGQMGTISAGRLTENNNWQSFATIRGAGAMPDTLTTQVNVPAHEVLDFRPPNAIIFDLPAGEAPPIPILVPERFHPLEPLGEPTYREPRDRNPYYYGRTQESNEEQLQEYEGRRSPRLRDNPRAELNPKQEADWYFEQQDPQYMAELQELNNQIGQPMDNDCRLTVTMPVAGHQEEANIYKTLMHYAGQVDRTTGQPLDKKQFEVLIFLNRPENKPADGTEAEIERFRNDHPEVNVRVARKVFPPDQVKYGRIVKYLNDIALLRSNQRTNPTNADLIMVTNDADATAMSKHYLGDFITEFDKPENKKIDGILGKLEWSTEAYDKYPTFHAATRFMQYLDIIYRRSDFPTLGSSGGNFALRSSIYAGIGGYFGNTGAGADQDLSRMIRAARIGRLQRIPANEYPITYLNRAWLESDARRGVDYYKKGMPIVGQWDDFNERLKTEDPARTLQWRAITTDQESIDDMDVSRLEREMNVSLDYYDMDMSDPFARDAVERSLGWMGVKADIVDGRLKLTNITKLQENLRVYRDEQRSQTKKRGNRATRTTQHARTASRVTSPTRNTTTENTANTISDATLANQLRQRFTDLQSRIEDAATTADDRLKLAPLRDKALAEWDDLRRKMGRLRGNNQNGTPTTLPANPIPAGAPAPTPPFQPNRDQVPSTPPPAQENTLDDSARASNLQQRVNDLSRQIQGTSGDSQLRLLAERDQVAAELNELTRKLNGEQPAQPVPAEIPLEEQPTQVVPRVRGAQGPIAAVGRGLGRLFRKSPSIETQTTQINPVLPSETNSSEIPETYDNVVDQVMRDKGVNKQEAQLFLAQLARDKVYADRYWSKQPDNMREIIVNSIQKSARDDGYISILVEPSGIEDVDREKMAAYRQLARELGYDVGGYTLDSSSSTMKAPIKASTPASVPVTF